MNLQKINWKFFLDNPQQVNLHEVFKVFNDWITDSPEIFIDVADYQHVNDGPLIALIGHYADAILDEAGRRRGFLMGHKRDLSGSNIEKLKTTFATFLSRAKQFSNDSSFNVKPVLNTTELQLIINDRALAPNTAQTLKTLEADLIAFGDSLWGKGEYTFSSVGSPKERFTVLFKSKKTISL